MLAALPARAGKGGLASVEHPDCRAVLRLTLAILVGRSENTSVSSSLEYWMLLTWQQTSCPFAVPELTTVFTVPLGAYSLMSSQPFDP